MRFFPTKPLVYDVPPKVDFLGQINSKSCKSGWWNLMIHPKICMYIWCNTSSISRISRRNLYIFTKNMSTYIYIYIVTHTYIYIYTVYIFQYTTYYTSVSFRIQKKSLFWGPSFNSNKQRKAARLSGSRAVAFQVLSPTGKDERFQPIHPFFRARSC